MTNKGQILEIPAASNLYTKIPIFHSKEEELRWMSRELKYTLFDGILVGEHSGLDQFQIGQRKKINVGGNPQPLFVIAKDGAENRLIVGAGENHPGLFQKVFYFPLRGSFPEECRTAEGLSVEVESPSLKNRMRALLFIFETDLFLEFKVSVPRTVLWQPLQLFINQQYFTDL